MMAVDAIGNMKFVVGGDLRIRGLAFLAVSLVGCGPPPALPVLSISAPVIYTPGDDTQLTLRIYGTDAYRRPGTGVVKLSAPAGKFVESGSGDLEVTLDKGLAEAKYLCNLRDDVGCDGVFNIEGTWGKVTSRMTVSTGPSGSGASAQGPTENGNVISDSGGTGANCGSWNSDNVYINGTVSEGLAGRDAITSLSDPQHPCPGLNADWQPTMHGGKILFVSETRKLRHFSPDAWKWDSQDRRSNYPDDWEDNDPLVPTPECHTGSAPFVIAVDPDSTEFLYQCNDTFGPFTSKGGLAPDFEDRPILALGHGDRMLVADYSNDLIIFEVNDGIEVPVDGLPASILSKPIRARVDGWLLVVQTTPRELWKVKFDGSASKVGTYPDKANTLFYDSMDGQGRLYRKAYDQTASTDTVRRLSLAPATDDVEVYNEKNALKSDWTKNPPVLFNYMHGSTLFTGP
jgi:hypothetical protein